MKKTDPKNPKVEAYTQLRSNYKQYLATLLQALATEYAQSQRMSPEEEEKYRAMWRYMLAAYKRKLRSE